MKQLRNLVTVLVVLGTLAVSVLFAVQNKQPVPLDLLVYTFNPQSLALWILVAFATGGVLGMFMSSVILVRTRAALGACRRQLHHAQEEAKLRTASPRRRNSSDATPVTTPVIVALDFPQAHSAIALAHNLSPELCRLKVGKELFTRSGPALVEELQRMGFDVFLDLKFHDIPQTVAGAVRAAAEIGVWMVNVHASGGRRMMVAAREAIAGCAHKPLLIGVTVLTSMSDQDLREVGDSNSVQQRVMQLAALAADSGLDGVVCSAMEAAALREEHGTQFCLVTPGIRLAGDDAADQRRVVTPADAAKFGSDYLVIGRSITAAADPLAALQRVYRELRSTP